MSDIIGLISEKKVRQLKLELDYSKDSLIGLIAFLDSHNSFESEDLQSSAKATVEKIISALEELNKVK